MSFGSLSAQAKEALGRGATIAGTSTTTGDGGMTQEERGHSKTLVYQVLPSRYGMNPDDLRAADAIELVVGQGAKPGGGGMLLGQKISDRVAEMRTLPKGIDQRSACRHPDWTGPDDMEIKIRELREITDWEKPIYVKVGGARPYYDVALAVKAGADVVVVDGMQGGTAATQEGLHRACRPADARLREARRAGAAGSRHAPESAAHHLRRHSQRRGCGEGVGARRRCGVDRHGGAGRDRRQRSGAGGGISQAWDACRRLRRLARGPRSGRHHDAGPGARGAARSGARRPPARQLPQGHDARGADHRPRLRQEPCAQSGAGGSLRADDRGGGDGARAAPGTVKSRARADSSFAGSIPANTWIRATGRKFDGR